LNKKRQKMKTLINTSALFLLLVWTGSSIAQAGGKEKVTFKSTVVCSMCKDNIVKYMAYEKGVKDISVDLKEKTVTIVYNPKKTTVEKLKVALTKSGYDADELKADPKAFDKLPECCKTECEMDKK
jgi:periplasmic mercuric ion binding protein